MNYRIDCRSSVPAYIQLYKLIAQDIIYEGFLESSHNPVVWENIPFSVFARTMRKVLTYYGNRIFIEFPNRGYDELRIKLIYNM